MKKLLLYPILSVFFFFCASLVSADSVHAVASFEFTPESGYLKEGDKFNVDILINSGGEEVVQARAVVTFDPTKVELVRAQRNNTLFEQYPEDGQTTDNENGVAMLTGFTQSGEGNPYMTQGEPDVFGRLEFKALRPGEVILGWEFNGADEPFKSVIMEDGSPPQNIMNTKPANGVFTIQDEDAGKDNGAPTTPVTAVNDFNNIYIGTVSLIGAAVLFLGGNYLFTNTTALLKSGNKNTVVHYDTEE
jgi:hypothetical protein